MNSRPILKNPVFWATAAGIATTVILACSSSSAPPSPSNGGTPTNCKVGTDTVACECANGQSGTEICGEPQTCSCSASSGGGGSSSGSSSGATVDGGPSNGDGGHVDDGATPAALYGACTVKGSFGYPCVEATSGLDPTDCTDPNYPYCFVGGQGSWCTALCDGTDNDAGACFAAAAEAGATGLDGGGCLPTACNKQGYCK